MMETKPRHVPEISEMALLVDKKTTCAAGSPILCALGKWMNEKEDLENRAAPFKMSHWTLMAFFQEEKVFTEKTWSREAPQRTRIEICEPWISVSLQILYILK